MTDELVIYGLMKSNNNLDKILKQLENEGTREVIMGVAMATRNTSKEKIGLNEQTEFQMHKSQHTNMNAIQNKIIDFTEHRLIKYAEKTQDAQQKVVLMALLIDYRAGKVAIAWKRGEPKAIRVTNAR